MQLAEERVGWGVAFESHVAATRESDHNWTPFADGFAYERREVRRVARYECGMVRETSLQLWIVDQGHDEVKGGVLTWHVGV
jgi:hypothetical protein